MKKEKFIKGLESRIGEIDEEFASEVYEAEKRLLRRKNNRWANWRRRMPGLRSLSRHEWGDNVTKMHHDITGEDRILNCKKFKISRHAYKGGIIVHVRQRYSWFARDHSEVLQIARIDVLRLMIGMEYKIRVHFNKNESSYYRPWEPNENHVDIMVSVQNGVSCPSITGKAHQRLVKLIESQPDYKMARAMFEHPEARATFQKIVVDQRLDVSEAIMMIVNDFWKFISYVDNVYGAKTNNKWLAYDDIVELYEAFGGKDYHTYMRRKRVEPDDDMGDPDDLPTPEWEDDEDW